MRYFLTTNGLIPFTLTVDELFFELSKFNGAKQQFADAKKMLEQLMDDENTVFIDRRRTYSILDVLCGHEFGEINAKVVLESNSIKTISNYTHARVIRKIGYITTSKLYVATLALISKDWLKVLVRKVMIDEMLPDLEMSE